MGEEWVLLQYRIEIKTVACQYCVIPLKVVVNLIQIPALNDKCVNLPFVRLIWKQQVHLATLQLKKLLAKLHMAVQHPKRLDPSRKVPHISHQRRDLPEPSRKQKSLQLDNKQMDVCNDSFILIDYTIERERKAVTGATNKWNSQLVADGLIEPAVVTNNCYHTWHCFSKGRQNKGEKLSVLF